MINYLKKILGDYEDCDPAGWMFTFIGSILISGGLYISIGAEASKGTFFGSIAIKLTVVAILFGFIISSFIKYPSSFERKCGIALSTILLPGFIVSLAIAHIGWGIFYVLKSIYFAHSSIANLRNLKFKPKPQKVKKQSKKTQSEPYRDSAPSCGECNRPL